MSANWNSWKSPLQASAELTFPHLGSDIPEEQIAFTKTKETLLTETQKDPDSFSWVKGVDTMSNRIV